MRFEQEILRLKELCAQHIDIEVESWNFEENSNILVDHESRDTKPVNK